MSDEVSSQYYKDCQEAFEGLDQLKKFQVECTASDKKIEEIWKSFRLLPLQTAYLIASHYHYGQWGWSLKTKWDLYILFDKILHAYKNPKNITAAIASALETQQKFVVLQHVFATLEDKSKTREAKAFAVDDLKKNHPHLFKEILHNIGIAKGRPLYQHEIEAEIAEHPNGCGQGVIKEMLHLYREGYPILGDAFLRIGLIKIPNL